MGTKYVFILTMSFIMLLQGYQSSSQCLSTLATTPDLIALPTGNTGGSPACPSLPYITSTTNTGTDIYYDGTADCQVMVWDGTRASLSWKYGLNTGAIQFASYLGGVGLLDPDVVVSRNTSGDIYALVVAEVTSGVNVGKIYWASFKWGGSNFGTSPSASGYLGDLTNGTCKNPNVDVNSCGRVAVAWAQRTNFNVTINVSGAPAGLNFGPIVLNMARGDIFIAQGYVDGTDCSGGSGLKGAATSSGDRASVPVSPMNVDHLFEVNLNPDVCISEPKTGGSCSTGEIVISIAYINQWFDPAAFAIKRVVMAKQFKGNGCVIATGSYSTYTLNCGDYPGRPRIASRPDNSITNFDDFQIVMADPSASCNPAGPPCNPWNTKIYNWGKHNGVAPSPTPSILTTAPINGCDLTGVYNNEAVVTYRNPALSGTPTGDYVVAWTNGGNVTGGSGWDVVAKTYNQGNANLAATGSTRLSIVNRGCVGVTGNQYIPSIAGRYSKVLGFAHFDQGNPSQAYVAYKTTASQPGSVTALRNAGVAVTGGKVQADVSESFSVQPNPFLEDISFRINLTDANKPCKIEITDASGRLVKTLTVPENTSIVTWKAGPDVSTGIYHAKLYTNQGIMVTQLVKSR